MFYGATNLDGYVLSGAVCAFKSVLTMYVLSGRLVSRRAGMNELQLYNDVIIFAIHKLNDLMTDKRTQNIKQFLSELSGKALAYLFPGVDKATIDEQSHAHLTEADVANSKIESPFPMCPQPKVPAEESIDFAQWQVYSDAIDLPEIECGSLRPFAEEREDPRIKPDFTRKAANPKRGRKKRNINFIRGKRYERVNDDLYDEDLRRYSQIEEPAVQDLEPDEQAKAILAEIDRLQRKYGITIEELEAVIAFRVKLSRLRITEKKAIVLEDFDHREVKMDTLTKAVFLLYLKHPEGIRYKELSDYQQELEEIYSSITGREDLDSIRKSVSDLCDPLNNSINEKVSKVKKAFKDVVNEHTAKFYYIDGKKGTAKRIALDRSLVLWG